MKKLTKRFSKTVNSIQAFRGVCTCLCPCECIGQPFDGYVASVNNANLVGTADGYEERALLG